MLIESKLIKVAVWEKINNEINIINVVKEKFTGSLDDLIEASDKAISKASFRISDENISKVIFSIPASWSVQGKIQANYLKILKNICSALSLKPLGFVVTVEAMIKALEKSESLKINYLLFHIGEEIISLNYVERGILKETVSSLRNEDKIGDDLIQLLSRLKVDTLPGKIIIFDGEANLEEIKQQIIKSPLTQKEKRFLHFPAVETLGENADITAVVHSVGEEMKGKIKKDYNKNQMPISKSIAPSIEHNKTINLKEKSDGIDKSEKENKIFPTKKMSENELRSLGFYIENIEKNTEDAEESVSFHAKISDGNKKSLNEKMSGKINILQNLSFKKAIVIILSFLIAVFLLLVVFWIIFGKAEVTLFTNSKNFNSDGNVFLATSKSLANNNSIFGKEITVTVSGEMEAATTGKKKTGEKAKGEVVIFNKNTDADKTFEKGTIITDGNLNFVLDNDVTVSAAEIKSESGSETKIFGKASVAVTAEKFGNEYNVADNKDWTIDGYAQSSYSAHNEREFSGGTTKEVQVVSEKDIKNLLSKLEKSLEQKAQREIKNKIDETTEDTLNRFTSKQIQEKNFSADENEEAKKISLLMKISFSSFAYKKEDAKKILEKMLSKQMPTNYYINQNSITLKLNKIKEEKDGYSLNFTYEAQAIPKINIKNLTDKIKIKPISSIGKELMIFGVSNYEIKINPPIPLLSSFMPARSSNIQIKLKY